MSKKKIITIISLLVVMVLSVSAISYSIAGLGNKDKNEILKAGPTASSESTYKTSIDLIIENSYAAENNTFNIVEVVPWGTGSSALAQYAVNGGFKSYVIDAYKKTATQNMKPDTIRYDLLAVDEYTEMTDKVSSTILDGEVAVSELLNSADLIYLSSPSYNAFNNKMSEDVYDFLHTYASGKGKPLIMDYVNASDSGSLDDKTYGDLFDVIKSNKIRYNTYPWPNGYSVDDFTDGADHGKGQSLFSKYQSTPTGKVLVVTTDTEITSTETIAYKLKNDYSARKMYFTSSTPPSSLDFTTISPDDLEATDLDGEYDFIVLENNIASKKPGAILYTKIKGLSESSRYIFVGVASAKNETSSGGSSYSASNNYLKLMSLLMTANGISKQGNVLSVRNGFFTSLNSATGDAAVEAAKPVADLLNASDYRGSKNSGAGGRKYRVLEIQPCYPIDLELAASADFNSSAYKSGGYYKEADSVLEGVTTDEIEPGTEYFAFHMSKAKIAHATGLAFDEIEVDQMSVNELISTKDVLKETYDMIYIGGDSSAYTPYNIANYGQDGGNWVINHNAYTTFTCFDMYTHTGLLSKPEAGNPFGQVVSGQTSFALSGHDISMYKLEELKDYVDAGLPVLIDQKVTDAFEESYEKDNRLEQLALKTIDPDCNMYKFLMFAKDAIDNDGIANVSWGEIAAEGTAQTRVVENTDGAYGTTIILDENGNNGVTVFDEDREKVIKDLYDDTAKRPSLAITDKPVEYDQNDPSTTNTESTVTISAEVTGGSSAGYDFYLLVDENGNGVYDDNEGLVDADSECKASASGTSVTLSYDLEDDFFGLVSWKVVAYSKSNGQLCDAKKGSAFFKLDPEAKKTCKVLQIMPLEKSSQGQFSDGHSLYFCTECQQAMRILDYNVTVDSSEKGGNPGLNSHALHGDTNKDGVYVGKHKHNFGIVKYNSSISADDWEENFADILTHGADGTLETGDFEFDLDIVTVDEFDAMCEAATKIDKATAKTNGELAGDLYDDYQEALESATLANLEETLVNELYLISEKIAGKNITGKGRAAVVLKGIGTSEKPGKWMIDKQYYKFFEYCNSGADDSFYNAISGDLGPLKTAYDAYIKAYDEVLDLEKEYKSYMRSSGTADTWLLDNYSIIVLGLADNFNGRDLSTTSCNQLKTYVTNGGSILNTHDAMTKYNNSGAVKLTKTLLQEFGMDRFHVNGISTGDDVPTEDGIKASLIMGGYSETVADEIKINSWYHFGGGKGGNIPPITLTNRDVYIEMVPTTEGHYTGWDFESIAYSDTVRTDGKVSLYVVEKDNHSNVLNIGGGFPVESKVSQPGNISNGVVEFTQSESEKTYPDTKGTLYINDMNLALSATKKASSVSISKSGEEALAADATDLVVTVSCYGTDGTTVLPESIPVTLKIGSKTYTAAVDKTNYTRVFTIPLADLEEDPIEVEPTYDDIIEAAKGGSTKYVKYTTSKDYAFFTERLIAESPASYGSVIAASGLSGNVKYNSPIGVTDAFAIGDASSNNTSLYLYVKTASEAFDHLNLETDGSNFEAKYGTRRASKVNQGSITTYPFAVSDELLISGTHGQWFQLDIEDPDVNVWYALGGNFVAPGVTAYFTRYDSAVYAASPRDGINNYFLYSKGNIFYSGAGHLVVTGLNKDNNDERKLFINVIVNSVNKGISRPKIKLYNVCPIEGDTNCEDEYVSPKDDESNDRLAKEMDKVFYNRATKMYQYNVEDNGDDIYPTFDFKVLQGSAELSSIEVFYDLNYGDGDGMDKSDTYEADANHVMILQYQDDKASPQTGIRQKLRESTKMPNLLLRDSYMKNYNNYTYIVIRAKDKNNKVKAARVKVTLVPRLFDLTDATFEFEHSIIDNTSISLDVTDKTRFNI